MLAIGAYAGYRYYKRLGAAADVTRFTPADADAVLWIPRVDEFTTALLSFTRGIQESSRLRELLKPETGVDLGDPDGLRKVGVDPEAGLVVFSKNGMAHILFGVEDARTFTTALKAKFTNLGFAASRQTAPDERGVVLYEIPAKEGDGVHAAFAADDGLMVLVYRGLGDDPAAGVRAVLGQETDLNFFATPRFKQIEAELGTTGPLLYASGDTFARDAKGNPRLEMLDRMKLPGFVDTFVRARVGGYLSKVSYAAARIEVGQCAATVQSTLRVEDNVSLLPKEWLLPDTSVPPEFGKLLPRDSVFFVRLGLNVDGPADMVKRVAKLGQGLAELGSIMGIGGKGTDPVAGLLGSVVHPDLSDRHVLNDIIDQLTGHVGIAAVGINRKARADDLMDLKNMKAWLGSTMQLVAMVQLKDPKLFWDTWWPEAPVLGKLGFDVVDYEHPEWRMVRLNRGCKPPTGPLPKGSNKKKVKKPVCEEYGVLLVDDVLVFTTGPDTLDRVYRAASGQAGQLHGLTREELALSVLEKGPMLAGTYFSFDGLLKAIRNLNLPGGATRYLAQMYEMAITLELAGGDATSHILLTR